MLAITGGLHTTQLTRYSAWGWTRRFLHEQPTFCNPTQRDTKAWCNRRKAAVRVAVCAWHLGKAQRIRQYSVAENSGWSRAWRTSLRRLPSGCCAGSWACRFRCSGVVRPLHATSSAPRPTILPPSHAARSIRGTMSWRVTILVMLEPHPCVVIAWESLPSPTIGAPNVTHSTCGGMLPICLLGSG